MIRNAGVSASILLLLAGSARADLPAGFDWDPAAVSALARSHPEQLDLASPDERARVVSILMNGSKADRAALVGVLSRAQPLDNFETFKVLDRTDATTVRKVYDTLDTQGQTQLLELTQASGAAGTAAGLQQLGIISDNDDTAFPTTYTPDGPYTFKGSGDFYRLLALGTDGKGDPGNVHYVSARLPALFASSRERLAAAGMPSGTFDGDKSIFRFVFGGLDGIEQSKEENIDLWLKLHPGERFVFLGDSLQRDPEVYDWVLKNHPDQVEMVMIHKAGGPTRDPADYKGEVFFDDYTQATAIVRAAGIVQPGALLPGAPDLAGLPLPDTDVSKITASEAEEASSRRRRTSSRRTSSTSSSGRRSPRRRSRTRLPRRRPTRTSGRRRATRLPSRAVSAASSRTAWMRRPTKRTNPEIAERRFSTTNDSEREEAPRSQGRQARGSWRPRRPWRFNEVVGRARFKPALASARGSVEGCSSRRAAQRLNAASPRRVPR